MNEASLDRPIWTTLGSVHEAVSIGTAFARRFDPAISPLGAAVDESDESLADLGQLVALHGHLVVGQSGPPLPCPPGARITSFVEAEQMKLSAVAIRPRVTHSIELLGEQEVDEMLALAKLTNPGPFARGTPKLGIYLGVKSGGRLVAMAGERMRQPGFTEVSAVCTHPDFTGQGMAEAVCIALCERILARGERPFLHVFQSNAAAKRVYSRLGFEVCREIGVTILDRA